MASSMTLHVYKSMLKTAFLCIFFINLTAFAHLKFYVCIVCVIIIIPVYAKIYRRKQ